MTETKNLKIIREKFLKEFPLYQIVYLTVSGSVLYGTNSENSDLDIKGIFIPSHTDVLLKKDPDHWTMNSNNSNEKNSADDIDCQLFSIYKFFNLLEKGETGAVDILFSMFRKDTIILEDTYLTDWFKENSNELISKKMQAFVGYAMGQSKRFGVKGSRYKELTELLDFLATFVNIDENTTIKETKTSLQAFIEESCCKYISIETKATSRDGTSTGDYLVVLGRSFLETNKFTYVHQELQNIYNSYGHRSKEASQGVDTKALSHALRVLSEAEELLETGFITFPLKEKEAVKAIKYAQLTADSDEMEAITNDMIVRLERIDALKETTRLKSKVNKELIESCILELLS